MGEPDHRDVAATARSQHVVHLQDRNHKDAARLLAPVLDRPAGAESPGVLVIVPAADDALRLAEARAAESANVTLLTPITSASRGRRQLAGGAAAIAAAPAELLPLLQESRLRLADLTTLVLVWPEDLLDAGQSGDLESVIAEIPRTVDRIAIVARRGQAVDEMLDRVMWRARKVEHTVRTERPVALRFCVTGPAARLQTLRTVLDALDPDTAALVVSSDASEAVARDAARALGAGPLDEGLRVVRGIPDPVSLAILFGDVPNPASLAEIAGRAASVVAIVDATRVDALRASSGGGAVPLPIGGAPAGARSKLDALRDALRETAVSGAHTPWVPVVEPLLDDLDPVEIAAAALAMLDRERRKARRPHAPAREDEMRGRSGASPVPRGGRERSGERGRESHERGGRPNRREEGDRGGGGGSQRGPYGRREFTKGVRPAEPRGRGARDARGREERPPSPRRDPIERVPRAAREKDEWATRGERLRHSRRGPRGRRDAEG